METKIEINGVWYVREDSIFTIPQNEEEELDITEFQGCVCETTKYCWEAIRLQKDDGEYHSVVDIKFTDKRNKPWPPDEDWDNNTWMLGVLKDDTEAITAAYKSMCKEGVSDFKRFLRALKDKGWFD